MSKAEEVILVGDDDNDNNNNDKRLPNVKKWVLPQHESLRCDLMEVVATAGMPRARTPVEDKVASPWAKLCNGLWDATTGAFRGHDCLTGSKRARDTKRKVFKDASPALKDKRELDVRNDVDPLPSFIVAKKTHDEHAKMLSDRQIEIGAEKQRKKDVVDRMKFAESTQGAGLPSMAQSNGDALTTPKTLKHGANLTINEDASTIASTSTKGGSDSSSKKKKIHFFICRKTCLVSIHS